MNREDPYRDQAERLRKKIDGGTEQKDRKKEALPPRSSLHHQKKKKTKWKLKYPVMSLLAIFFILLPIAIFSIYTSIDNEPGGEAAEASKTSYETVDFGETADEPAAAGEQTAEEEKQAAAGEEQAKDSNKDTAQEEKQDSSTSELEKKSSDAAAVETGAKEPENTADKEKAAGEVQAKPAPEQKETSGEFVTHTVQPGETMFRISMKYFKSQDGIEIIRQANGLSGNEIHVGQVLKIPQNQ